MGIDPPGGDLGIEQKKGDSLGKSDVSSILTEKWGNIRRGEENAKATWVRDLYGVGTKLTGKRLQRGWRGKEDIEELLEGGEIDVEIADCITGLLEWTGGDDGQEVYRGPLPWDALE